MNERLTFSWSHIIAFLALIAVGYLSFMGFCYLSNGNIAYALTGMGIILLAYIIVFIGAQQLKASGVNIRKKIWWERLFILVSPLVLVAGMVSISHFFTVNSREDHIVSTFSQSINSSKQMFDNYEKNSKDKIAYYENMLDSLIQANASNPAALSKYGFTGGDLGLQRDNMVTILKLMLLSDNYQKMHTEAVEWIDKANSGATTWNIFMLGNTQQIREAISNWNRQLDTMYSTTMSNLAYAPKLEDAAIADTAVKNLDSLTASFTQPGPTLPVAIIFGIVVYLMLIFPYLLQDRHSKSVYRLIGRERTPSGIVADEKPRRLGGKRNPNHEPGSSPNNSESGYHTF